MYKDLKSYQQATVVYDYTLEFCKRHIKNHKISTQMIGAARDGQENIVESSENKVSEKIKTHLLGASRYSLGELKGDYENFLRQNGFEQWTKDDPKAVAVRSLVYKNDKWDKNNRDNNSYLTYYPYLTYLDHPADAANAALCIIHQASYLVDQQLTALKQKRQSTGNLSTHEKLLTRQQQEAEGERWLAEEIERLKKEK